jgi:hypothetical protein
MNALLWVVRILVILLLIRMALRLLFPKRAQPPRSRRSPLERSGGMLVRDPHCGTYVPESRALALGSGDSAQYFCSAECRDAYTAARRRRA